MGPVEVSDHISLLVSANEAGTISADALVRLPEDSLQLACDRVTELSDHMDPVLLTRCLSKLSRADTVPDDMIQRLSRRAIQRIPDMPLGCLARLIFSVAARLDAESGNRLFRESASRILELTSHFDTVPPKVAGKLFVGLPRIQQESHNTFLWERLESFALHGIGEMDPEHVQQVAYGIAMRSSFDNPPLVTALLKQACSVADKAYILTHMALIISLSRLPKSAADEELWSLFKRLSRDRIGLKDGPFPLGLLRTLLGRQNGSFTDHQLRRIRYSLKM